NVHIVLRDNFRVSTKTYPRLIIAAHIFGSFVACWMFVTDARATTVVGFIDRNNHAIVLAADSMTTNAVTGARGIACKTNEIGDCALGFAGHLIETALNLDFRSIAVTACIAGGTLQEKHLAFERVSRPDENYITGRKENTSD